MDFILKLIFLRIKNNITAIKKLPDFPVVK